MKKMKKLLALLLALLMVFSLLAACGDEGYEEDAVSFTLVMTNATEE